MKLLLKEVLMFNKPKWKLDKVLALENFLAQQIPTSVTITKSEPEPKKEEQIEIEKPKKRVIDFD